MRKKYTTASELAEMGYCEKKMLFEHRLGRRVSAERRQACLDGQAAHETFHRDATLVAPGLESNMAKPWCFIASELFGPHAEETMTLRRFRDVVLRKHALGRDFVGAYYRHSPAIARWLRHHPAVRKLVRASLRPLVALLRWRLMRDSWHGGVG